MEFSFDKGQKPKSQDLNNDSGRDPKNNAVDPFHQARSQHYKNESSMSSETSADSANDRLKKALERNRMKQEMRPPGPPNQSAPQNTQASPSTEQARMQQAQMEQARMQQAQMEQARMQQAQMEQARMQQAQMEQARMQQAQMEQARMQQAQMEQARMRQTQMSAAPSQPNLFDKKSETLRAEKSPLSERLVQNQSAFSKKEKVEASDSSSSAQAINDKPQATALVRQRVARVEEEFTTPVKKVSKKVQAPQYLNKKKVVTGDSKLVTYAVRGAWILSAIMVLRLIFSQGGVVDFYNQKIVLSEKRLELEQIKLENDALANEISRMQMDSNYQKKIVRDNLGFIAQDEFLILFPKEI